MWNTTTLLSNNNLHVIHILPLPLTQQLVDIYTKSLTPTPFRSIFSKLGMINIHSPVWGGLIHEGKLIFKLFFNYFGFCYIAITLFLALILLISFNIVLLPWICFLCIYTFTWVSSYHGYDWLFFHSSIIKFIRQCEGTHTWERKLLGIQVNWSLIHIE